MQSPTSKWTPLVMDPTNARPHTSLGKMENRVQSCYSMKRKYVMFTRTFTTPSSLVFWEMIPGSLAPWMPLELAIKIDFLWKCQEHNSTLCLTSVIPINSITHFCQPLWESQNFVLKPASAGPTVKIAALRDPQEMKKSEKRGKQCNNCGWKIILLNLQKSKLF